MQSIFLFVKDFLGSFSQNFALQKAGPEAALSNPTKGRIVAAEGPLT